MYDVYWRTTRDTPWGYLINLLTIQDAWATQNWLLAHYPECGVRLQKAQPATTTKVDLTGLCGND